MTSKQGAEVFDFQASIARLADDVELFRDMVRFYLEDAPGLLEQARHGLRERNAAMVERAAHTLKGMSSTFDAHMAVAAALEVEQAAQVGPIEEIDPLVTRLESEVRRLAEALRTFRVPAESSCSTFVVRTERQD